MWSTARKCVLFSYQTDSKDISLLQNVKEINVKKNRHRCTICSRNFGRMITKSNIQIFSSIKAIPSFSFLSG